MRFLDKELRQEWVRQESHPPHKTRNALDPPELLRLTEARFGARICAAAVVFGFPFSSDEPQLSCRGKKINGRRAYSKFQHYCSH